MNQDETVILTGPRTENSAVIVAALNDEGIPARMVATAELDEADRPDWLRSPAYEISVVVPRAKRDASMELIDWLHRVCLRCETTLMPRVTACQKCGTPHLMVPGPFLWTQRT